MFSFLICMGLAGCAHSSSTGQQSSLASDRAPAAADVKSANMEVAMVASKTVREAHYEHLAAPKMGGRKVRVRFFLGNEKAEIENFLKGSEGLQALHSDPIRGDGPYTYFGALSKSPAEVGYANLGNNNYFGFMPVLPLVMCATDLLRTIEPPLRNYQNVFRRYKVDEVNIFIRVIGKGEDVRPEDSRLDLAPVAAIPRDPALNLRIPFVIATETCLVPSVSDFIKAIEEASDMPADMPASMKKDVGQTEGGKSRTPAARK